MDLRRLTPASLPETRSRFSFSGRCAACEKTVNYRDPIVHLYGEAFHYDCAFYRPLRKGARQGGRARPA